MRAHKRDRRDRSWTRPWIATAIAASSLTCTYTLHHDTQGDDSSSSDTEDVEHTYEATVRRTTHGVAHVLADDYGSAGFGLGYAFAEDHLCTLADQVIKVRSQRARYLGPGALSANINSDFAHLALDVMGTADAMLASTADVDALAVIEGYTAGYNKYLDEVGRDGVGGWCQGAEWLVPIEPRDVAAYALTLGMVASGTQLIDFIATAQPPGSADAVPGPPLSRLSTRDTGIGSNGWALGKERTASGRGMVLANPHFPWEGELRLWESHVTIPDELNIYGVSLLGVPAINIGFNEDVAWTHTFSQEGQRMIIYMLDLVPGDPTRYYYGDEERAMSSQTYTIDVRQPDGGLAPKALTMYFSHYGPIINPLGYGWSETQAVTYRDANVHNDALISQFMGMNRARSLAEFKQVFSEVQGMPWAHTMAADREGDAWYIDAAATPNLSAQAINTGRRRSRTLACRR
ncbi:MAG: penicillin acylase family protein [Nannocystaceae bacterium]